MSYFKIAKKPRKNFINARFQIRENDAIKFGNQIQVRLQAVSAAHSFALNSTIGQTAKAVQTTPGEMS